MALASRARISAAAPAARRTAAAAPRMGVRARFNVTMRTPEGDVRFECGPETLILDAAEEAGVELPFLCRSGTCMGCTGRRVEGCMVQTEQSVSGPHQEQGFALLCQSYPRSDLVIMSHQEHEFYLADQFSGCEAPKTSSR
ncbi:chloroplast ferredoxin [Raphidocelis subcapitata]|uniref:Ferredoxin n=1 Tax=Raphidocelis subcapitata TaxID=307507 RepID=A0A2V0PI37_9CHLO|nr:chloroplast ferredoxin [Raphidocelis subcapitata]|eukprot:GBF99471.1 chloroplast ferredoxin [Raphidocelis subcapitata]